MEVSLNINFEEMTQNEIMDIDGGIGLLAAAAAVAGVCAAGHGCYQIGVAVGKFVNIDNCETREARS